MSLNRQLAKAPPALDLLGTVAVRTIVLVLLSAPAWSQESYRSPRTEHGYPDLQGIWTNATITPLQRPDQYGEHRAHSADEARALEQNIADANAAADKPTERNATIQDLNKSCELRLQQLLDRLRHQVDRHSRREAHVDHCRTSERQNSRRIAGGNGTQCRASRSFS